MSLPQLVRACGFSWTQISLWLLFQWEVYRSNRVLRLCSRVSGTDESTLHVFCCLLLLLLLLFLLELFFELDESLGLLEALFFFVGFLRFFEFLGLAFLSLSSIGATPPERKLLSKLRTAFLTSGKPCSTSAVNEMSLKSCSFTVSVLVLSWCDDPWSSSLSLDSTRTLFQYGRIIRHHVCECNSWKCD